ncbi:hypothetical protein KQI84_03230 [bacterium]|nr:hypothetical protein [bacterium]
MRKKKIVKRLIILVVLASVGAFVYFFYLQGASEQDLRNLESNIRAGAANLQYQVGASLDTPSGPSGSAVQQAKACRANLRRIESAKRALASQGMFATGEVSIDAVRKELGGRMPSCPSGGQYRLGSLEQLPTCSIGGGPTADTADDHILRNY